MVENPSTRGFTRLSPQLPSPAHRLERAQCLCTSTALVPNGRSRTRPVLGRLPAPCWTLSVLGSRAACGATSDHRRVGVRKPPKSNSVHRRNVDPASVRVVITLSNRRGNVTATRYQQHAVSLGQVAAFPGRATSSTLLGPREARRPRPRARKPKPTPLRRRGLASRPSSLRVGGMPRRRPSPAPAGGTRDRQCRASLPYSQEPNERTDGESR